MHCAKILSVLLVAGAYVAPLQAAEPYAFDKAHTSILFFISHMGYSEMSGEFRDFDGELLIDPADLSKSSVKVTIKAASIDTDFVKLDEHLRSPGFFDVAKFPTLEFVSTAVEKTGADRAKLTGNLTMHGVTKPVTLDLKINKIADHPMMKVPAAGFQATATLKRSDFGISYGVPNVGDEVTIRIDTEAQGKAKAKPAAPKTP